MNKLARLMDKQKHRTVYADKGYCSQKNRDFLKKAAFDDGMMHGNTIQTTQRKREAEQ